MKIGRIGKALIFSFLAGTSLATIAGIVLLFGIERMDVRYTDLLYNYAYSSNDTATLNGKIKESGSYARDLAYAEDSGNALDAKNNYENSKIRIQDSMNKIIPTLISDGAKQEFAPIQASLEVYYNATDRLMSKSVSGDYQAAKQMWLDEASGLYQNLSEQMDVLQESWSSQDYEVTEELQAKVGSLIVIGFILVIGGIIVSILMAVTTSRKISIPVTQIQEAAFKMEKGEFDIDFSYHKNNELGDLVNSMSVTVKTINEVIADTSRQLSEVAQGNFDIYPNVEYVGVFQEIRESILKITDNLSSTIQQVILSSRQVTNGSQQVADAAQSLAQGATEQAGTVQELSASLTEISSQANASAENARYANELTERVGGNLLGSNARMSDLIEAMEEITQSSEEIGNIIKAIEDLAFQTNILALNAAVEAARAGSAGKGFAVVADEVRNLAGKSSEAAKQTNELIANSVRSVEKGFAIAAETAEALAEVVQGSSEITGLINQIANASAEQSNFINRINEGVNQVSAVIQINSATSEESAASSEELSSQANILKNLVSSFKVK